MDVREKYKLVEFIREKLASEDAEREVIYDVLPKAPWIVTYTRSGTVQDSLALKLVEQGIFKKGRTSRYAPSDKRKYLLTAEGRRMREANWKNAEQRDEARIGD